MQLTRLDRWLIKCFVHETRIQTLRYPESVPQGIITEELPEVPGKRFRYQFIIRRDALADAFVAQLKEENLMFSTTVVDRTGPWVKWIAPPGKSFTWRLVSWTSLMGALVWITVKAVQFFSNPAVQKLLKESLKDL